jgi:hypothetical protein
MIHIYICVKSIYVRMYTFPLYKSPMLLMRSARKKGVTFAGSDTPQSLSPSPAIWSPHLVLWGVLYSPYIFHMYEYIHMNVYTRIHTCIYIYVYIYAYIPLGCLKHHFDWMNSLLVFPSPRSARSSHGR